MTTDPVLNADAPAPLMLADLNHLSAIDVERAVALVCSAYGTVVKVAVHLSHGHLSIRAFALVDMSGPEEAEQLAVAFNRRRMGSAVLLLLQPRTAN